MQVNDADKQLIQQSELFDADWYCAEYSDVITLSMDPATHYLQLGWRLGRNPSSRFSSVDYLMANPDVARSNINPLLHYLQHGKAERRPLIDPIKYADSLLVNYIEQRTQQQNSLRVTTYNLRHSAIQQKLEHYFVKSRQLQQKLQQLQDK